MANSLFHDSQTQPQSSFLDTINSYDFSTPVGMEVPKVKANFDFDFGSYKTKHKTGPAKDGWVDNALNIGGLASSLYGAHLAEKRGRLDNRLIRQQIATNTAETAFKDTARGNINRVVA